jgi:hypothetical protein
MSFKIDPDIERSFSILKKKSKLYIEYNDGTLREAGQLKNEQSAIAA